MMRFDEALVQTRLEHMIERYEHDFGRKPGDKVVKQMREIVYVNMLADREVT